MLDSPQIHRVKVARNIQQPLWTTGLERGKNESMMGIYWRRRNPLPPPPAPISSPPPAQVRACLHGGGGPQVVEVTRLAVVEK